MNGSEVKVILCEELENLKKQIIEQHLQQDKRQVGGRQQVSILKQAKARLLYTAGRSLTCWRQGAKQERHRRTFRLL